jgi:hypothetical protein
MTATLANGGQKEKRRALDFYPTPREVTVALLEHLKLPPSQIWEPACGQGAMSQVLEAYGHTVYSSDIADICYGTPGTDFLTANADGNYNAVIHQPALRPLRRLYPQGSATCARGGNAAKVAVLARRQAPGTLQYPYARVYITADLATGFHVRRTWRSADHGRTLDRVD